MLAEKREQGNKESQTRSFFNLSDTKTYDFNLPELVRRKCFGASFGWLLTIGTDLQINLFHPFSKHLISLPPQPTFCHQFPYEMEPEELRGIFVFKAPFVSTEFDFRKSISGKSRVWLRWKIRSN